MLYHAISPCVAIHFPSFSNGEVGQQPAGEGRGVDRKHSRRELLLRIAAIAAIAGHKCDPLQSVAVEWLNDSEVTRKRNSFGSTRNQTKHRNGRGRSWSSRANPSASLMTIIRCGMPTERKIGKKCWSTWRRRWVMLARGP